MANAWYPKAKEAMLQGQVDLAAGTLKAALIDTNDYTYSAAHDFWDDAVAGLVGTPQTIGSKTFTNGVLDGADVTFTAVTGDPCEAIIIFLDTGTPSTSRLILYLDTGVTNLPVTPNGGDIGVQWDNGANKIAAL